MLTISTTPVQSIAPGVLKYDPGQPRGPKGSPEGGQFTQKGATITVGSRTITVVKPLRAKHDKLVPLNVNTFDAAFQQTRDFYLGVGGGTNAIGERYARFGQFLAENDSIEASEVFVGPDGSVGFINGRHRYAWLRDHGLTSIPVAMTPESVQHAKTHGYLAAVKVAWDETKLAFDANQPRDTKGRWTDLGLHGETVTLLHGTTRQNAEAILAGGFQPGDPARIADQIETEYGLPKDSILTHVAFQFARGRQDLNRVHFTTDESVADQYSVPEVLQDALTSAHMLLFPTPDDVPFTKEKHQQRQEWIAKEARRLSEPALLAVTVPFGVVGQHGFGRQFTLESFHDLLRQFPDAEGNIFNNISLPLSTLAGAKITRRKWEILKQEHSYGNTQIEIDPWSSAAASCYAARNAIKDEDLAGAGKDVDPNHVTVRYGLLNDDLDELRDFLAAQAPFKAEVFRVELFPPSEHSDGAVPVVARVASPELHVLEAKIGEHAAFKDKSFPVYKPHCTLAYCKPGAALQYQTLLMRGTFLVSGVTISHASGVLETIPFGMTRRALVMKRTGGTAHFHNRPHWDESKHPRHSAGSSRGGEFMSGPRDTLDSLLNNEKNVTIQQGDVRTFLEMAAALPENENPDLTDLRVEGMKIFGGDGLGIERDDMPQIPPEHRQRFLEYAEAHGVTITAEQVDPLTLKPTQNQISARRVGQKLAKYEKGNKKFPSVLVSRENRILDGHHHWGMMAAFALEIPEAKMPIFRMHVSTKTALALMHAYMKIHKLERASISGAKIKVAADPESGRYVTPFVSFDKQGDDQLRMIASLNSSRLATWGFTAEAEVLGMARYKVSAVLDGRTSEFCRMMNGKIFDVSDARDKVIEVLNVQDPEDLRVVQPWPKQTKAAMAEWRMMSAAELTEQGLHIPPYHPFCRTILRPLADSVGQPMEKTPTIPGDAETFQAVTQEDLAELGVDATPEEVAQWNDYIGMSPTELLSKLTSMTPHEVLTKGKGVGANPIQFDTPGTIGIRAAGESTTGVEFKLGAILDPFTGIFYLSQADLLAGTPKAEAAFLKTLLSSLIDVGTVSTATSVAVGVAGNAAYYVKLGFLPDDIEWETLRTYTLTEMESGFLKPVLESLAPEDQLLVTQLLQDRSVTALSALVDLPFMYEGRTLGEWILRDTTGTWGLDLLDEDVVDQAKAYLT